MRSLFLVLIFLLVFTSGLAVAYFFRFGSPFPVKSSTESKKTAGVSSASQYRAVFLDNDQVYFGRLSGLGSDRPVLRDVFYLRLTQSLQDSTAAKMIEDKLKVAGEPPGNQPELSLVKLGSELHGPADLLELNPRHILFIEDLRKDSRVVLSIENYKTNKK